MNRYPAVVAEVDRERREVRVEIPGLTDGADRFPLAEIEYPIGDRSEQTEIRILPGDRVWVSFINGDSRYPIITGFRTKHTDNEVGTRRWVHDNFELVADGRYRLQAGESIVLEVGASVVTITDGKVQVDSGQFEVNAETTFNGNVNINGNVNHDGSAVVTGDVVVAGISFTGHKHGGVAAGSAKTSVPE